MGASSSTTATRFPRRTLLHALLGVASALGGTLHAAPSTHAQDAQRTVEIVYAAPASCPSRDAFEARLRARLGAAALSLRSPVRLAIELRAEPERVYGSISLTDAHGVLGPRAIEAERCSEAVDALSFVAALLLDDRARTAAGEPAGGRARVAPGEPHTPRAAQAGSAQAAGTVAAGTPTEPARPGQSTSTTSAPTAAAVAAAPGPAPAPPPPAATPEAPTAAPAQPAEPPEPPEPPSAGRPLRLRGSLAVSALAVSGVAPSVRPGLGVWAALAAPLAPSVSLSLALGVRTALREIEHSPDGTGTFHWWSSVLSLCAALGRAGGVVHGALCLDAEAGQIVADGTDTEQPDRVRTAWLALGPAARVSVHVRGRWQLVPGVGLLLPGTRDRFVIGPSELHQVPRLTFRAELALLVEWP